MRRGRAEEADAITLYEIINACEVKQCGFMRLPSLAGYSPDGLVGDDGLVEVKSRKPPLQIDIIASGGIPPEHKAQIQGGLWIAERQWCDYVSYSHGLPLYVCRCERDEDYIVELEVEVRRFATELDALVEMLAGMLEHSLEAAL
jgi:hypothetical protein